VTGELVRHRRLRVPPLVFRALSGARPAFADRDCVALGRAAGVPAGDAVPAWPAAGDAALLRARFLAWGVNGFFTVIGTVLALMLGMMIGFRMVLLLACACYLAGFMAISLVSKQGTQVDTPL